MKNACFRGAVAPQIMWELFGTGAVRAASPIAALAAPKIMSVLVDLEGKAFDEEARVDFGTRRALLAVEQQFSHGAPRRNIGDDETIIGSTHKIMLSQMIEFASSRFAWNAQKIRYR
jgi:hypothetical protein